MEDLSDLFNSRFTQFKNSTITSLALWWWLSSEISVIEYEARKSNKKNLLNVDENVLELKLELTINRGDLWLLLIISIVSQLTTAWCAVASCLLVSSPFFILVLTSNQHTNKFHLFSFFSFHNLNFTPLLAIPERINFRHFRILLELACSERWI